MLKALKRLFVRRVPQVAAPAPADTEAPMRRWSKEQLSATKASLESKDKFSLTVDDYYNVVEYLVQRYLPDDNRRTEVQWLAIRKRLRAKVDENIELLKSGLASESWADLVSLQEHERRYILRSSYFMSREDFDRILLPALERFPFGPLHQKLSEDCIEHLWLASATHRVEDSWDARYAAQDARDRLLGRFHPVVLETCTKLRRNYEVLRRAKNAECVKARLIVQGGCTCYGKRLNGVDVNVDNALLAFEGRFSPAMMLPPPDATCCLAEDPRLCDIGLVPISPVAQGEDFDPDFQTWLDTCWRRPKTEPLSRVIPTQN